VHVGHRVGSVHAYARDQAATQDEASKKGPVRSPSNFKIPMTPGIPTPVACRHGRGPTGGRRQAPFEKRSNVQNVQIGTDELCGGPRGVPHFRTPHTPRAVLSLSP